MLGYLFSENFLRPITPLFISQLIKILPLLLIGIVFIYIFKTSPTYFGFYYPRIKKLFLYTWYFNEILTILLTPSGKIIFHQKYKLIDSQLIESFTSTGVIFLGKFLSSVVYLFSLKNISSNLKSLLGSLIITIFFTFLIL